VLVAAYAFRNGTVTAVTAPNYDILEHSDAVARDPVFGGRRIAYRFEARTNSLSLVWSHALGPQASLNLTYRYQVSVSDGDMGEYYSNFVALSFGYRY
jgi:hypothetical protein